MLQSVKVTQNEDNTRPSKIRRRGQIILHLLISSTTTFWMILSLFFISSKAFGIRSFFFLSVKTKNNKNEFQPLARLS